MSVKRVLISLGHPAHYQFFKNVIKNLNEQQIETLIVIRKKDILENLLTCSGLPFYNIFPNSRKGGVIRMIWSLLVRDFRLYRFCLKKKPDLMIGSTVEITHVGKLLNIPAVSVGEDDYDVVPLIAKIAAPFSNCIVAPEVCRLGKWERKAIKYKSYQELAYLHPNHFKPDISVVNRYFDATKPYFIFRFAKLTAHHDKGIKGIDSRIALNTILLLKPYGNIYITSERGLEPELEKYRLNINPLDIHHVMAFAQMYIGDSQTMAAEAGVLGVPFIRFNDFVGRISYLKELEEYYQLGYGIKPDNEPGLYQAIDEVLKIKDRKSIYESRRLKMLEDKIDLAQFYTWFIKEFPESKDRMKENSDFQKKFN
jgi:predicted glycosyltransferase